MTDYQKAEKRAARENKKAEAELRKNTRAIRAQLKLMNIRDASKEGMEFETMVERIVPTMRRMDDDEHYGEDMPECLSYDRRAELKTLARAREELQSVAAYWRHLEEILRIGLADEDDVQEVLFY